jgi:uncharacterized protein (DUF427 family)
MIRACLAGVTLAESEHAVMVEGNHYFPPDSLNMAHLERTRSHSLCPWKGIASYYTVTVGDQQYKNAAWTYRHPSPLARRIKNHVAFWPFVAIEVDDTEAVDRQQHR